MQLLASADPSREIVTELVRLTGGDPLWVGLYADSLWDLKRRGMTLRPSDLQDTPPGLRGFFDRWLADQVALWGERRPLSERAIQHVLAVLAAALGPLRNDELRSMMERSFGQWSWSLPDTLAALERFVRGDGVVTGYTFSHPRLAEFFGSG